MVTIAVAPDHEVLAATDDVTSVVGPVPDSVGAIRGQGRVTGSRGVRRSVRTAAGVAWPPRVRACPNPGSRTR